MSMKTREEMKEALREINKQVRFQDAHLELVSDETSERYLKFIEEHFYPEEVLAKSIELVVDQGVMEINKQTLKDNMSILLISDITGDIIASRGIAIGKKGKSMDFSDFQNDKLKTLCNFVFPDNEKDIVHDLYSVETWIQFLALGTHKDHRRKGIASKMTKAGVLFCQQLGLDPVCVKGEGSSNYSQRIYEKNGFEIIRTSRYDEYKIDGEIVFKNTGDHETLKIYLKNCSTSK